MDKNFKGELSLMKNLGIKPNFAALGREYGMDPRTVKKYYEGYEGKPKSRNKPSKLDKHKEVIRDKLTIKRITVRGVYEFMIDTYGYDSIGSYSNFITYIRKNKLFPKDVTKGHPRFDTPVGKQGQVDWKEDIPLVSRNNEKFVINVMQVVLKHSTYSHLDISIQKKTDDVYRCLINSFKAFGGVPAEILFDNMSTVVNVSGRKKEITKGMAAFAKDFGFKIRLCGTRKPETKGTVEAKNKVIDWIRAYNSEFDTIDDLMDIIEKINKRMNLTVNNETGMSPMALFYKEKEYLHSLPPASVIDSYLSPNKYKVSTEALIRYENSKYSVNPKLIGEEVTVDVLSNKLYIYYKGKLVTSHQLNSNPINYHEEHYRTIMKGKVKETDIDSVVSQNLQLMDKLLENRSIEVSNTQACKSEEALIAYMNDSSYGNWIINYYSHMSKENQKTFVTGMQEVLPFVADKDAFMSRLKYSVKKDCCKTLAYDCLIEDFMMAWGNYILTDEGYELFKERYNNEFNQFIEEEKKAHEEDVKNEQLQCTDK